VTGATGATRARLTWAQVCARRLERHWLATPARGLPLAEVVGAMCGAHAQVLSAAELSVGLRLEGVTRAQVREALWSERSLVKTRGPRGTVHLLPAQDLARWCGALAAVPSSPSPSDPLTAAQTEAVVAAIDGVLTERGAELTAEEMDDEVIAATGPWAAERLPVFASGSWPRWRWAMGEAATRGVLCFGPNRGNRVTYTSTRRWLPGFRPAGPAAGPEALAWLVRRFLYAYGPATAQQFAQWVAGPRRWATALFESLAGELEEVEVEGRVASVLAGDTADTADPGDTGAPPTPPGGVRLLPYFDAYGVGCHPRELVFPGVAKERALAGGQAGNFPVLLLGGVVGGVWQSRRSGKAVELTVEPFGPLEAGQRRELEQEAQRTGEILEARATLRLGAVSTGAHA
jgi:Winged helix DNA-binding domain